MAANVMYQIVGRFLCGKEVTGYQLKNLNTSKLERYSKEQVCLLVGRRQITNCDAQLYKDKVILRGVGMQLESLPVYYDVIVDKDKNNTQYNYEYTIVGRIVDSNNTIGYILADRDGKTQKLRIDTVIKLVRQSKVANAILKMENNKEVLIGNGCSLLELPQERVQSTNKNNDKHLKIESITQAISKQIMLNRIQFIGKGWSNENTQEYTDKFSGLLVDGQGRKFAIHLIYDIDNGEIKMSILKQGDREFKIIKTRLDTEGIRAGLNELYKIIA